MHVLGVLVLLFCASASGAAQALEYCDNIKEPDKRMACLQARISSLEEKILALSNQIVDLRNALRQKIDAGNVYKMQHMGRMGCLGISAEEKALDLQSCDNPDSWKLLPGSQKPGRGERKKKKDKAEE